MWSTITKAVVCGTPRTRRKAESLNRDRHEPFLSLERIPNKPNRNENQNENGYGIFEPVAADNKPDLLNGGGGGSEKPVKKFLETSLDDFDNCLMDSEDVIMVLNRSLNRKQPAARGLETFKPVRREQNDQGGGVTMQPDVTKSLSKFDDCVFEYIDGVKVGLDSRSCVDKTDDCINEIMKGIKLKKEHHYSNLTSMLLEPKSTTNHYSNLNDLKQQQSNAIIDKQDKASSSLTENKSPPDDTKIERDSVKECNDGNATNENSFMLEITKDQHKSCTNTIDYTSESEGMKNGYFKVAGGQKSKDIKTNGTLINAGKIIKHFDGGDVFTKELLRCGETNDDDVGLRNVSRNLSAIFGQVNFAPRQEDGEVMKKDGENVGTNEVHDHVDTIVTDEKSKTEEVKSKKRPYWTLKRKRKTSEPTLDEHTPAKSTDDGDKDTATCNISRHSGLSNQSDSDCNAFESEHTATVKRKTKNFEKMKNWFKRIGDDGNGEGSLKRGGKNKNRNGKIAVVNVDELKIGGRKKGDEKFEELADYPPANSELEACLVCGRTFLPETLVKHVRICERMATKKRKQFDSSKQRMEGTELAAYNMPRKKGAPAMRDDTPKPRRRDWKEQHMELVETIRASRQALMEEKRMKEDPNYVPSYKRSTRGASYESSSAHGGGGGGGGGADDGHGGGSLQKKRVPAGHDTCPYCERNFCTKAYDRHVEWCKEKTMIAKQHKTNNQKEAKLNPARERLAARTKYKVPALKTKRAVAREKYSPNGSIAPPQNNENNNNKNSSANSPSQAAHSNNNNSNTMTNKGRVAAINARNNSSGNLSNNHNNNSSSNNHHSPAVGRKQGPLRRSSGASASSMTEMAKHSNAQGPVTGIKGRGDEPSIRRQPSVRRANTTTTTTKSKPCQTRNTMKPSTVNLKLNFDLTSPTTTNDHSMNLKNLQYIPDDANYGYDPFVSAQMQMIELYTPDASESEKAFSETSEKSVKSIKDKKQENLSLSSIIGQKNKGSGFYLHDPKTKTNEMQSSAYEEDYYIDPVLINDRDGFSTAAASDHSSDDTFETYESMMEILDDIPDEKDSKRASKRTKDDSRKKEEKSVEVSPKLNRSKRIDLEKFDLKDILDDDPMKNYLDTFNSPSPKSLDRKRLSKKTRQEMLFASCDDKILYPPEEFQVFSTSFDADSGFSTDRDVKQEGNRLYNDYLGNSPSPQRLKNISEYARTPSPTKTCEDFEKLSRTSSPSYSFTRSLRNTPSPERVRVIPIEFSSGRTSPNKNVSKSLRNSPSPASSGRTSPSKKAGVRCSPERIIPIKLDSLPVKNVPSSCVANSSHSLDDSESDKTLDDSNSFSLNDSPPSSSSYNVFSRNDSDSSPVSKHRSQQQQHVAGSNKHHQQRRDSHERRHHSTRISDGMEAETGDGVSPARRTATVGNAKKNVSADSAYGSLSRSSPSGKANASSKSSSKSGKEYAQQQQQQHMVEASDRGDCSGRLYQQQQQQQMMANSHQQHHHSRNSSINSSPKHRLANNNEDAMSTTSGDSLSLTLNKLQLDVASFNSPAETDRSVRMSKFCHECGSKFPLEAAKFCVECGVKRLAL